MSQQTALEWFIEKTTESGYLWLTDKPNDVIELTEIIKQAKAMEKEQITKAVDRGYDEGCKFPEDMTLKNAEQYYNETYGS